MGTGTGLRQFLCRGRSKAGGGGGGKGVRAVRPESVAGRGGFEVLWNVECPIELSQREIYAHFNEGQLAQFGRSVEK